MRRMALTLAAMAVGASCATAFAGDGPKVYRVGDNEHPRRAVIVRKVVAPEATVSKEIYDQPVYPHLVEVSVVNTTIYLDPDKDYRRQGHNPIDENHSILKAQRLAASLMAKKAHIVTNPAAQGDDAQARKGGTIRLMFFGPGRKNNNQDRKPRDADGKVPLMAMAD